jgi:hypothetical protein
MSARYGHPPGCVFAILQRRIDTEMDIGDRLTEHARHGLKVGEALGAVATYGGLMKNPLRCE